jgi:hypothetical protein
VSRIIRDTTSTTAVIFLGIVVGFTATRFISDQISSYAFWSCREQGKLVFLRNELVDVFYCEK